MCRLLNRCLFGLVLIFAVAQVSAPATLWAAGPVLAVATDGHEEGVPLELREDLAVWSLVAFVIFVLVLRKFAWGPLSTGLNRRENRVRQDIAAAESARIKAEQMLAEHQGRLEAVQEEVREIIAEARRDAEHTKNDIIATAQREAEASKQRALNEIERARQQALKDIFDQVSDTVIEATEHVLGRSVTDADQDRLIGEALAQVSK